ncbi:hypothetical protein ACFE04_005069 [Oxalis oulophora]
MDDATNSQTIDHNSIDGVNYVSNEEPKPEPHVGMRFESLDEAKEFYKYFSRLKGFGFRIRSTKNLFCYLVCSSQGYRVVNTSEHREIGNRKDDDKWMLKIFANEHSHVMVSPKSVPYIRCHKKMTPAAKSLVGKFNEEGLPNEKICAFNSSDPHLLGASRRMHVNHETSKLATLAEKSEDIYQYIINNMNKTLEVASSMETNIISGKEASLLGSQIEDSTNDQVQGTELSHMNIKDPHKSHTKGRKKDVEQETQSKRFKSGLEVSCSKSGFKKRKCGSCGEYGHYRISCKNTQ